PDGRHDSQDEQDEGGFQVHRLSPTGGKRCAGAASLGGEPFACTWWSWKKEFASTMAYGARGTITDRERWMVLYQAGGRLGKGRAAAARPEACRINRWLPMAARFRTARAGARPGRAGTPTWGCRGWPPAPAASGRRPGRGVGRPCRRPRRWSR